jgi:D-hydroxyproline dehydrogenase subunit beta
MSGLPRSTDVLVVGGGIVGACIARELAISGRRTTIVDRGPFCAGVSGASLACLGTHMHSLEELPLLIEATRLWSDLADSLQDDIEYRRCGQLRFVLEEADAAVAKSWVDGERAAGLRPEYLEPAAVAAVEPLLTGPVLGASWSPDDAVVNPFLAVRAILADGVRHALAAYPATPVEALVERGGRVIGARIAGDVVEADRTVVAAGPWTRRLLATVGLDAPVLPRQAQCLATVRQPPRINGVVGACESAGGVEAGYTQIQQAACGQILFNTVAAGGLTETGAEDEAREAPSGFVVDSIGMLIRLFPALASLELLRSWVRFEAVSPDGRFLAGPTPMEGLLIAAGDNGSGFCRAPLLGRLIADLVGDTARRPPRLYDPARFLGAG